VLLFVGRLDPQKAPFRLLEAVRDLWPAHLDLHVLLVGQGPLEAKLHAWVRQHEAGDRVHFAGRREDVPELMAAATCFVLTSRWEGMPNVVLEAMAAGLPIVATGAEGVRELLGDGEFGVVVPRDSTTELTKAIAWVLANSDQAGKTAMSAQDVVHKNFTCSFVVQEFDALYCRLLAREGIRTPQKKS
jgi:glycosyltransferase involved in cell wall biosynthesis